MSVLSPTITTLQNLTLTTASSLPVRFTVPSYVMILISALLFLPRELPLEYFLSLIPPIFSHDKASFYLLGKVFISLSFMKDRNLDWQLCSLSIFNMSFCSPWAWGVSVEKSSFSLTGVLLYVFLSFLLLLLKFFICIWLLTF